jgi:hypothetical protein
MIIQDQTGFVKRFGLAGGGNFVSIIGVRFGLFCASVFPGAKIIVTQGHCKCQILAVGDAMGYQGGWWKALVYLI